MTAREAAQLYADASSKGGNILLNVGPDRFGAIAHSAIAWTSRGAAVDGSDVLLTCSPSADRVLVSLSWTGRLEWVYAVETNADLSQSSGWGERAGRHPGRGRLDDDHESSQ